MRRRSPRVFDLGIAAGQVFIAGELVIGATLAELPALPLPIVTTIAAGACAGLHYLHECAVPCGPLNAVHRHLSPSTIAVGCNGSIKILGAGLEKLLVLESERAMQHLSPEQCLGRPPDRRSDVYSFGAVLWELTVGRPRFPLMTDVEVLRAIARTDAVPPSAVVASYPPALDHIVRRALQREPAMRYQTIDDLHAELDALPQASLRQLAGFVRNAMPERAASSLLI